MGETSIAVRLVGQTPWIFHRFQTPDGGGAQRGVERDHHPALLFLLIRCLSVAGPCQECAPLERARESKMPCSCLFVPTRMLYLSLSLSLQWVSARATISSHRCVLLFAFLSGLLLARQRLTGTCATITAPLHAVYSRASCIKRVLHVLRGCSLSHGMLLLSIFVELEVGR